MLKRHRFEFSQNTFGGSLACTAVATLAACGFADGSVTMEDFEKYCRIGSKIWKQTSGWNTMDAEQIINHYDFFKDTYTIESYQSYTSTERAGLISITKLLETLVQENHSKESFGIVMTDGGVSFAVGHLDGKWWLFDSHSTPTATLYQCSVDQIEGLVVQHLTRGSDCVFDATSIVK